MKEKKKNAPIKNPVKHINIIEKENNENKIELQSLPQPPPINRRSVL